MRILVDVQSQSPREHFNKYQKEGPNPEQLNQNLWKRNQVTETFRSSTDTSSKQSRLRTTEFNKETSISGS